MTRIYSLALLVLLLAGCAKAPQTSALPTSPSPATSSRFEVLTAAQVLDAFKKGAVPIENEVIYTEESDLNNLLGRPHQYIGKANWNDKRADKHLKDDPNMTVEVFASAEDMESRRNYTESVTKRIAPLAQYQFTHKNALLRLHHQLTPTQAAEYEKILKAL